MGSINTTEWLKRAFLHVEGSLLIKSASASPSSTTEEYVRTALCDGLKLAKHALSESVMSEYDVPWNGNPDIKDNSKRPGRGKSKQHDIVIVFNGVLLAAMEVKWLKTNKADAVVQDVWRLLLTCSVQKANTKSPRVYLVIGGEKRAFQQTMKSLRETYHLHFKWSPQGRATNMPMPFNISPGNLVNTIAGQKMFFETLKRSANYYREPTDLWWKYRLNVVARGWKTINNAMWKIAVWELSYNKRHCGEKKIDWINLESLVP